MSHAGIKQVLFTAPRQAELAEVELPGEPLAATELAGRTLATAVSAGTELAWAYTATDGFPRLPGYAAVFEVEQTGESVTDVRVGDRVFCAGSHASWQRIERRQVVPVPPGLATPEAPLARLMAVSMATLTTTTARPPDKVLVTGLGPVGHLAAKTFAACGYDVTAVEPIAWRRDALATAGVCRVEAAVPEDLAGQVQLVVECSGHEQAALDGCTAARKRGEVVLVGVPWRRQTDLSAQALLHAIFHRYVVVRSGWEWEMPAQPVEFRIGSTVANYAAALNWLAAGRVCVEGIYQAVSPAQCGTVYRDLLAGRFPKLVAVFDWTILSIHGATGSR